MPFDDIRPFDNSEIPMAMKRIVESPHFPQLAQLLPPSLPIQQLRQLLLAVRDKDQLQVTVMKPMMEYVLSSTVESFTASGIERLDPSQRYLFLSNHRDIVLDAALLDYYLYLNNHPTAEITFGENLMDNHLFADLGKANGMFRVVRGGGRREFYRSLLQVSQYMRYAIHEKHRSVWIAQRNGRTKDGLDRTDPAILKMLALSDNNHPVETLLSLNIVPMTISYEWEPCDLLKTKELFATLSAPYVKGPNEDLVSIFTGLKAQKGRVHLALGTPITESLLESLQPEEKGFYERLAVAIDAQIHANYQLSANNYIALDLLAANSSHADNYTPEQFSTFQQRLTQVLAINPAYREIFLKIYANPVMNQIENLTN